MSPQGIGGDDRCGIYALVKTYELVDKKTLALEFKIADGIKRAEKLYIDEYGAFYAAQDRRLI